MEQAVAAMDCRGGDVVIPASGRFRGKLQVREACMHCERKRSGRKKKESHAVLLVKFSLRRN